MEIQKRLHDVAELCSRMEEDNRRPRDKLDYMAGHSIDAAKFYGAALDVKAVAALHGVSTNTVRSYIAAGLIPPPSEQK